MSNRAVKVLAILALAAFASATVQAAPISYTSYSVLNNQKVTLSDPSIGISSETGGSGQVTLSGTNTPGGSLQTWCVDIAHSLLTSGTFATVSLMTGPFANQVNALLSNGIPKLGTDTNSSSALQVAIWEEEYGSALSVTASDDVTALANKYLANVANGAWMADPLMQVVVLNGNGSNQSQALLVRVPEPTSLAILGAGVAAVALIRRRRARRDASASR